MEQVLHGSNIVGAIVYSLIGLGIFGLGFVVLDRVTPYQLWKEIIEEHNIALAIVIGAISIGICLIIASAIH
jgi:putative membrane protein